MDDTTAAKLDKEFSLYVEPFDVLHPDDWDRAVSPERSRNVFVGVGCADDVDVELVCISIKDGDAIAGVVLDTDELRRLTDRLTADLKHLEGNQHS
jgi:hypothetical protein